MPYKQNSAFCSTVYGKTFSLDKHKNGSNMEMSGLQNVLQIMVRRRNPHHLSEVQMTTIKIIKEYGDCVSRSVNEKSSERSY
jgi:hypothetical protein